MGFRFKTQKETLRKNPSPHLLAQSNGSIRTKCEIWSKLTIKKSLTRVTSLEVAVTAFSNYADKQLVILFQKYISMFFKAFAGIFLILLDYFLLVDIPLDKWCKRFSFFMYVCKCHWLSMLEVERMPADPTWLRKIYFDSVCLQDVHQKVDEYSKHMEFWLMYQFENNYNRCILSFSRFEYIFWVIPYQGDESTLVIVRSIWQGIPG